MDKLNSVVNLDNPVISIRAAARLLSHVNESCHALYISQAARQAAGWDISKADTQAISRVIEYLVTGRSAAADDPIAPVSINDLLDSRCQSYGCDSILGPDSGIIDGDRYCADCVAAEATEAGKAERLQDAELVARGEEVI